MILKITKLSQINYPFTGRCELKIPIKCRLKDTEEIRHFFDGSEDYDQQSDLTLGKVYEIHAIEGFGDVFDVFFKNDKGEEVEKMSDWFEDVDKEGKE